MNEPLAAVLTACALFFLGPWIIAAVSATRELWEVALWPIVEAYRDWRFRRYCRRTMPAAEAEAFIERNCP